MPQISEVSVRFVRKIQVRDYEPAESEVGVKATLLEGEDPKVAVDFLQTFVSGSVHGALGLPTSTALPKQASRATGKQTVARENVIGPKESKAVAVEIPGGPGEPAQAASAGAVQTPAETAKPSTPAPAVSADTGLDIPSSAAPTPTPAAKTVAPKESKPVAAQPAQQKADAAPTSLSPAELSKWIGEQVRSAKVSSEAIKALYPKFGVTRFMDLKPEQCGAVRDAVLALVKGNTNDGESGVVMA